MTYAKRMTQSTDKVDKRLINLYMLKKAHEGGHLFGFENDILQNEHRKLSTFPENNLTKKFINQLRDRRPGRVTEMRNLTSMEE